MFLINWWIISWRTKKKISLLFIIFTHYFYSLFFFHFRNRDWVSTGHHKSSQARVDVSIFERISENKLRFRLYSPIGHALWLELDSLRSEILRVRVYETTQTTRYQGPKEVLLPFVSNDSLHQTLQIVGGDDSLK